MTIKDILTAKKKSDTDKDDKKSKGSKKKLDKSHKDHDTEDVDKKIDAAAFWEKIKKGAKKSDKKKD